MYRRKDQYYRRAKDIGYRARSAFKLEQLARGGKLLRQGDRVVELGAWPGGWLQVAAAEVGLRGRVVGVDLQAIESLHLPNVVTIVGDIREPATMERVLRACAGPVDVLLSDLAPKLTGVRPRDEAQTQALADQVLQWADRLLKPGGNLVVKLFMAHGLHDFVLRLHHRFRAVRLRRPDATRAESAEVYAVAIGFLPIGARERPSADDPPFSD
jgi:23S rRNA (uridine2552-2'-O)-methyltransferase